jgi:hypothetical protein
MKDNINEILKELYAIDPELKKYEDRLKMIVEKFLEAKPDTKFDEAFARSLKSKILAEPMPEKATVSILSLFNMNKNYILIPGAVLAVFVLVLAMQIKPRGVITPKITQSNGVKITKLAAGAFGNLAGVSGSNVSAKLVGPSEISSQAPAFGRGGGGGGGIAPTMGVATAGSPGTGVSEGVAVPDAKMMIYRPYQIKYVYKGDKLELTDKTLDVYRRVKPDLSTSAAVGVLNGLSFGGLDLSSFAGSQLTNFELSQPGKDGYITNVNLRDGQISIGMNYFAVEPCLRGVCPQIEPLQPSQMPSNEEIIAIADKFLKDHGVSVANYGQPKVEDDWRRALESTVPTFAPYVPDVISVVYPNILNGMTVYEMGGNLGGMRVNVDVRKKVATGAWSIFNQAFESSAYEAETDASRIIKFAENGGIYNGGYASSDVEVIEIELGTPVRSYVNMWKSDGSGEVTVPALAFPLINPPKDNRFYYQSTVVIPLIKEMLEVPEPGPIQIMKASEPVTSPEPPKGL